MVSLVYVTTPLGDLEWTLEIRQYEISDFLLYRFASVGDVAGMQNHLSRKDTILNVTWYSGWTPMHVRWYILWDRTLANAEKYAITYGHASICTLLL